MEAETVLNLYDSYWFFLDLFNGKPPSNNHQNIIPEIPSSKQEIPILPTIHTKLKSPVDKISSILSPRKIMNDYSNSPNSVLESPKLKTIFSGKVSDDFHDSKPIKTMFPPTVTTSSSKTESPRKNSGVKNIRKRKGLSKSLSDLEFEELKGFIDLGFVFSEDDRNSNLLTIIPGLQRFINKNKNTDDNNNNIDILNNNNNCHYYDNDTDVSCSIKNNNSYGNKTYVEQVNDKKNMVVKSAVAISRPYLSESWDVLEKKRKEDYLMNWRIPAPINQDQMKDNLRFWAHTVASTVR